MGLVKMVVDAPAMALDGSGRWTRDQPAGGDERAEAEKEALVAAPCDAAEKKEKWHSNRN